jgi:hypothetical protein
VVECIENNEERYDSAVASWQVSLVSVPGLLPTKGLELALAQNLRTVLVAYKLNAETHENRYFVRHAIGFVLCPLSDLALMVVDE